MTSILDKFDADSKVKLFESQNIAFLSGSLSFGVIGQAAHGVPAYRPSRWMRAKTSFSAQ